jgi:hypothetical protein
VILLFVFAAVTIDREFEVIGQRIDDGHADAVQAAGNLVRVVIELAASVEHGHHDLRRRTALFGLHVDRNAAPVVDHADSPVGMDGDGDMITITSQRFVD